MYAGNNVADIDYSLILFPGYTSRLHFTYIWSIVQPMEDVELFSQGDNKSDLNFKNLHWQRCGE